MDSVTFVRKSFLDACKGLVVVCELDDDIEVQVMVDKQQLHVVCLTVFKATFCPTHDETFVKKVYVLVQALEECNAKVFGTNCLGFQIACKLDSIAPSMCAPWLSMLKSLASSSFTMYMHAKSSGTSLANVWPELGGRKGLRSTIGVPMPWLLI
jgi:hypothetical protein